MSTGRCENCPVPAGLACYENPGMCRRAAKPEEVEFRATLVRHAETRAKQNAGAATPACGETLAMLARMKKCPNWVARSDCGCGVNECRVGKGKAGLVSRQDCFACLAISPLAAPAGPSGTGS